MVNFTASVGLTQKAAYRDRWQTTDEYLQHYVDWKEKNTYGVNAETGEYAAYSRPGNEYTSNQLVTFAFSFKFARIAR